MHRPLANPAKFSCRLVAIVLTGLGTISRSDFERIGSDFQRLMASFTSLIDGFSRLIDAFWPSCSLMANFLELIDVFPGLMANFLPLVDDFSGLMAMLLSWPAHLS